MLCCLALCRKPIAIDVRSVSQTAKYHGLETAVLVYVSTVGSRFTTIHFHGHCRVGPGTHDLWCITFFFNTCIFPACSLSRLNPLTPNNLYSGRTSPLTSKRFILYIYSTNTGTEYFKHGIHSPFFSLSLQNAVCFIILTYLVPFFHILYTVCVKI